MLSALIPSIHSYPAVHLVAKPVDQRYVQPSPLVLRPTPLKYKTPVTDRDRPVSRNVHFLVITDALDYTTISIRIEMTDVLWISHPFNLFKIESLRGQVQNVKFEISTFQADFPRYYPFATRSVTQDFTDMSRFIHSGVTARSRRFFLTVDLFLKTNPVLDWVIFVDGLNPARVPL